MCGLVGVAGNLAYKDEGLIKKLLFFDYLRGIDSTGMAAILLNGEAEIAKIASNPLNLFAHNKFNAILYGAKSKVFLGHNRASTKGATNDFNAHPFHYDHIIGAHNGTLDRASWTRLEDAVGEKFNVDSQALIKAIAVLGIKGAIELCTEGATTSDGAWALTWYDQNEGSLNFLRNKWRPMWYAYDEEFKRIIWASESWMIEAAVKASGSDYKLFKTEKEGWQYFPTSENTHYKFDIGLLMQGAGKPKPKIQTIKGREPPPVSTVTQGNFPMRSGNSHGSPTSRSYTVPKISTMTSLGSETRRTTKPDNVLHWLGSNASPLAGVIKEEDFNVLAKHGCSWCCEEVPYDERGMTIYERDSTLICADCSGNDPTNTDSATRIYLTSAGFEAMKE